MAQSTNHQPRSLTHDDASAAWDDAYSYKAEIERREQARRELPIPTITITAMLIWSAFWFCVLYLAGWAQS
ncbi:hypothetical protein [Sphingobium fuliginis]|uniref:Uncharacterized protein n=1 Tax=Sphingobium fuliginis ATCC 27551 TaxID=1208342 RepID=A0A5B8CGG2_SPHSA|nr:hypothetical protein [Sphingobium fuliginis]QDC37070.1 hypothetical protein FIL70_07390 [Sphingobium fuliginis ATCC 27551]